MSEQKPATTCDPNRYEGDIAGYVDHLVNVHGCPEEVLAPYRSGLTESEWLAVDRMHRDVAEQFVEPAAESSAAPAVEAAAGEVEVRVEHQVWVEETDGTRRHAHFMASPETYDDLEHAKGMAQRYNDEQIGWNKPLPHRRFYVRSATVTTTFGPGIEVPPSPDIYDTGSVSTVQNESSEHG